MGDAANQTGALEWLLAKIAAKATLKPPALLPLPKVELPKPTFPSVETEAQKQKRMASTRATEEEMWHDWIKSGKHPDKFVPLWKSQQKLINHAVSKFQGIEVNKAALKGEATDLYWDALESWNPKMEGGAALRTHVLNNLRGLKRYALKYQNTARITEPTADVITPFRAAQVELREKLGYDPALYQVVEHTNSKGWNGKKLSMRDALEVSKYVRKGYDISAGGDNVEGAGTHSADKHEYAARLIYHSLKPDEKKVHELLYPRDGGKAVTGTGEIAKKLGWHISKVSKARTVIRNKTLPWVGD